jgi:hypothetical protein
MLKCLTDFGHEAHGAIVNKKFRKEQRAYFPYYGMDRVENDAPNNSSIVVCIDRHGNFFIEPLPHY